MAVDTTSKRFSMMDWEEPARGLPLPDGSFDQGDRQHLLDSYSGNLFDAPVAPDPTEGTIYPRWRRRRRR